MGVLFELYDLVNLTVFKIKHQTDPIWLIPPIACCDFYPPRKTEDNSLLMKQLYHQHVYEIHRNSNHIYTDGSKMGENVGCAVLHRDLIYSKKLNGYASIYNAELRAVLKAVKLAKNDPLSQSTVIFTDSQSVKNSMEQINSDHPLIVEILHAILEMSRLGKSVMVYWVPAHIGVPQNEKVDREAKAAAENDSPESSAAVHYRHLYPAVRVNLQNEWEQSWINLTDNKLRDIKDNTRVWNSSLQKGRKTEVVLTRLRIGHTRLTHGWLIDRTQPPVCLMFFYRLNIYL